MTLKTIKISERIYKKLLDSKKDEESITDFLERLLDIKEQSKDSNSIRIRATPKIIYSQES